MGESLIYKERAMESNGRDRYMEGFQIRKGQGPPDFPTGLFVLLKALERVVRSRGGTCSEH